MNITYTLNSSEYANELYKFSKIMALDYKISNFFKRNNNSSIINLIITNTHMEIKENKSFTSFMLTDIVSLKENEKYIYILTNLHYEFIIPKSSFKIISEMNNFINNINSLLLKNDKNIYINKIFFIYKNKFLFTNMFFTIPLLFSIITFFSNPIYKGAPFYCIFFITAAISFLYETILLYGIKKIYKFKKKINLNMSLKIEYINLNNNISSLLNKTTLIELNFDDFKKLVCSKNNIYIQSNSLIFLNQCFFPQKHFNFKCVDNKYFKIKKNVFLYQKPFWLISLYIGMFLFLIPLTITILNILLIFLIYLILKIKNIF